MAEGDCTCTKYASQTTVLQPESYQCVGQMEVQCANTAIAIVSMVKRSTWRYASQTMLLQPESYQFRMEVQCASSAIAIVSMVKRSTWRKEKRNKKDNLTSIVLCE
eukprot:TRINITY_DN66757_c0_g5_i1.p1 TRINITY_DN66757_c0_g5~~TRINITY_DN66757_c0_g5_i1.p1  ORF type:complete len:106 (-),score=5.51 TRINITY_DN66757_c0_g5_i1:104-421(-)